MKTLTMEQASDAIYDSLAAGNEDIDLHIAALRTTMAAQDVKVFTVDPARLLHNNRAGRKMMQSYFKKQGVKVEFSG